MRDVSPRLFCAAVSAVGTDRLQCSRGRYSLSVFVPLAALHAAGRVSVLHLCGGRLVSAGSDARDLADDVASVAAVLRDSAGDQTEGGRNNEIRNSHGT